MTGLPPHDEHEPMRASDSIHMKRQAVRDTAARFRTANPRIFGSAVGSRNQEDGNLEILVDPLPGATLFDLGGLQIELETLLGLHVDLLTPDELPSAVRARVLAEAKPV